MILDEICAHKRAEVDATKTSVPLSALKRRLSELGPPRDFRAALRAPGISLIAEVKKASPSKGVLRPNLNPVELGGQYERAGASAISVLTDKKYFQGALADLTAVRRHVGVPCLRKEFIVDEYQIYEARAAEADAILLIAACLDNAQMQDFEAIAEDLDMAVLVEVHDRPELERALKLKFLGMLFAAFTSIAAFGIGNMVQANSISDMLSNSAGIPRWVSGAAIMALTAAVILGGVRSIARVCGLLVPFMAVFYVFGCVVLLVMHYSTLDDTVALIWRSAFSGHAAVGGFLGAGMRKAVRFGVARGLFSNESGLGSAPIVAAAAQSRRRSQRRTSTSTAATRPATSTSGR